MHLMRPGLRSRHWSTLQWPKNTAFVVLHLANTAARASEAEIQAHILLPADAWSNSAAAQLAEAWFGAVEEGMPL